MHIQDYALCLFLAGGFVCSVGVWALSKHWLWWKDALQVGGVMLAVAMAFGVLAPKKVKSPEQIALEENDARESERGRVRHTEIIDAMTACDYGIKARLRFPGSYSSTMFSSANRQIETSDGWEIYTAFEAKNGFGGSIPQVGHCSIKRTGTMSVDISDS